MTAKATEYGRCDEGARSGKTRWLYRFNHDVVPRKKSIYRETIRIHGIPQQTVFWANGNKAVTHEHVFSHLVCRNLNENVVRRYWLQMCVAENSNGCFGLRLEVGTQRK